MDPDPEAPIPSPWLGYKFDYGIFSILQIFKFNRGNKSSDKRDILQPMFKGGYKIDPEQAIQQNISVNPDEVSYELKMSIIPTTRNVRFF